MAEKEKFRVILSILLLHGWMFLIFGMSSKTGEESAGLSYRLASFLYRFPLFKVMVSFDFFHTLIRKMAHFTEYGILSLLVLNVFHSCRIAISRRVLVLTAVFCMVYAATDEYHQSFVEARGPSVRDVLIDTAGAVCFLIVFSLIKSAGDGSKQK